MGYTNIYEFGGIIDWTGEITTEESTLTLKNGEGSIVNMGVKNEDGSVCYVIGILKAMCFYAARIFDAKFSLNVNGQQVL